MLPEVQKELVGILGERVAFHEIERMLYSADLGALPGLVKKQINTLPDAVVQPDSSNDLIALMGLATKYRIPLVPRGSGTAGYGGAVPTCGGIVVDFHRLNRVLDINEEKKLVTVEPGVVWNDLETELRNRGLALRLYPGSALSATVGGWIANGGGVGIGSYEYGYIRDSLLEAEIVTPTGIKRVMGDAIDSVYGMAGTTGLIFQVSLMVRDSEDDVPVLGAFPSLGNLMMLFQELRETKLALWEVGYRDPRHVRLSREAVERQAKRLPMHGEVKGPGLPPDKFIVMFVYPKSREGRVRDKLLTIVRAHNGEALDEESARAEWDERFYPVRLKALGPSLVPSEVIIPTEKLSRLIDSIRGKMAELSFNGTLLNGGDQTTVMTYSLDDERRRGFPLAYSRYFVPVEAAKRLGGRPYTIGMYLNDDAALLFGKNKLLKIHRFKEKVDPAHIMNPGKVFPRSLDKMTPLKLNLMLKLARTQARAVKIADRLFGGRPPGEVTDSKTVLDRLPFGGGVIWDAFTCASCGYCRRECPEFNAIGWESASPRGKFHFLREYIKGNTELDERMAEMFFVCTTCRQCNEVCQVKSYVEEDWTLAARPAILQTGFHPPTMFQRQAYNILSKHNPSGAPQDERKAWMPSDLKCRDEGEVGYWAGCASSFTYLLRNLPINAIRVLNSVGIELAYLGSDEWCCGGAMFNVGCLDEVSEMVEHNLNELNRRGIKTLITSCSGCWLYLAHFYPLLARKLDLKYDLTVKHITEIVSELIEEGKVKCESPVSLKVTYHDPCHIGRAGGIFEPPRKILSSIPGLELIEMPRNRQHAACCGRHVVRYPRLGGIINSGRTVEAAQTGASAIVCSCPTCENNFRLGIAETGVKLEVIDIMDLVAESMGLPTLAVSKLAKLLYSMR